MGDAMQTTRLLQKLYIILCHRLYLSHSVNFFLFMGYVMQYYKSPIIAKTTAIYFYIAFNSPLYIAVNNTKTPTKNPSGPENVCPFIKVSKTSKPHKRVRM